VVNNESGNCNVGLKLPDLLPIDNTIYGVYVPDTNEVWVTADDLSVPADGGIFAIELNNNLNMVQIATTVGDKFYSIIYIPNVGVLVSRTTALQLDKYNPTTRNLISSVAVPDAINEMIYIASINEVWATQSTLNLIQRINPNTLALIGTIAIPGVQPTSLAYIPTLNEVWVNCYISNDTHRVDVATNTVVGVPIVLSSTQPLSVIQVPNGNVWVGMNTAIDVIDPTTFAIIQTISIPGLTGLSIIEVGGLMYVQEGNSIQVYDPNLYTLLASYPVTPFGNRTIQAPNVLLSINSNSITPFLLDCNNSLPTNTFALKDIYIDWKLQFDFFDNTEYYVFQQKLAKPSLARQADATDITDVVYNEQLENGATQVITTLCKSTNVVTVVTTFPTPKEVFSVAVEIQPIRGGVVSTTAPSSTVIIPVTSPYISKLNPAILTPTATFSFDLDVPALPIDGDYEINLNYILK
jgi:streptogramin lyase